MVRWLGLALLGILVAAGVAIAASRLASQQIGLASEPIGAGDALAPAAGSHPPRQRPRRHRAPVKPAETERPPVTTAPPVSPPVTTPEAPPAGWEEPVPPPRQTAPRGGDGEHGGGHADD
jgi:hypothetical protein